MNVLMCLFVNLLSRVAFLAAMCYCIKTDHLCLAAWCLVGAILCGISLSRKDKAK